MTLFLTNVYGTPVRSRLRNHFANGIYSQYQYLDLPNEILFMITAYLGADDLNSLIQTSQQFSRLLMPHLYTIALTHVCKGDVPVLVWAAREGRLSTVERMIMTGRDQISREDAFPALYLAASNGHTEIMGILLIRLSCFRPDTVEGLSLDDINHSVMLRLFRLGLNPYGNILASALHAGAYNGHEDVIRMLLAVGVSREAKIEALSVGASKGREGVVELLLSAGMVKDSQAVSDSLRDAARGGHTGVVQLIITSGAEFDLSVHAFMHAVYNNHHEVVKTFVSSDSNIPFPMLSRGLRTAMRNGQVAIAHVLLNTIRKHEIQPKVLVDALHASAFEGDQSVTRLVLDHGEHTLSDDDLSNALFTAVKEGNVEVAELLLKRGATADQSYSLGRTSLHEAAAGGYDSVVRRLLDIRTDTSATTEKDETAVHLAAMNGHAVSLQELIHAGADISSEDVFELTPLHWAAYKGFETASRVLIESGADPGVRNSKGWTPLNLAALERHERVVELLLAVSGLELSYEAIQPVLTSISMRNTSFAMAL